MSGAPLLARRARRPTASDGRILRRQGRRDRRHHQGSDRNARAPGGRRRRRRHHLQGLQGRRRLPAHEGRLLGLPVLDRHAQARHPEPAAAFRAGRGRSPAGLALSECYATHARIVPGIAVLRGKSVDADQLGMQCRFEPCASLPSIPRSRPARPPCSTPSVRGTVAHESLPMVRGHAEALMPLIARVHGPRRHLTFSELDRIAVTTGPGSFTGLRVGISAARGIALAAGKPAVGLSTLAAYAAPLIAADDTLPVVVGDRCAARPCLSAGVRARRPHRWSRRAWRRCARRCAWRRPARRAWSAPPPICWRQPGRPASGRRRWSTQRRAPDIDWVARLGAAAVGDRPRRRSRSICARPTRSRRTPRNWPRR